jgi:MFS family permease
MDFKKIIPLYLLSLFGSLATSAVIPILSDLDHHYGAFSFFFVFENISLTIGSIEAIFVFVSTLSLLFWGYKVDKSRNRNSIFAIGLLIFIIGNLGIILISNNMLIYIIGRCLFMGIGLGAIGPAAHSYAGDLLSFEKRSTINSTLSITGIGGLGVGIILSGILSRINLFLPFTALIILAIVLMGILYFYPEPIRGSEEPEIRYILESNSTTSAKVKEIEDSYSQNISILSVKTLFRKKTNLFIFFQGFFALFPSIIFSYYLISYLHDSKYGGSGLDLQFAIVIAMGSASGRLIGFPIFGWLGDKFHFSKNKFLNKRGRALIPAITMFLQAPIMIIAFLISLPSLSGQILNFPSFLLNNTQFIIFSIVFFIGAFVGGGSGPNRSSIIYDANEPELRGQTSSLLAIGDQFGASIGLLIGNLLIISYGYSFAFIILSTGYFISGFFWLGVFYSVRNDSKKLRVEIEKRIQQL